ncbi:hypothetical protein ACWXVL_02925 [Mycoplasma sp. 128]
MKKLAKIFALIPLLTLTSLTVVASPVVVQNMSQNHNQKTQKINAEPIITNLENQTTLVPTKEETKTVAKNTAPWNALIIAGLSISVVGILAVIVYLIFKKK